jgi:hypothetical protein
MHTIAQNGLLRKDHYQAGFTLDMDDHVMTLKRYGKVIEHFGFYTPLEQVHEYLDHAIEEEKAVTIVSLNDGGLR